MGFTFPGCGHSLQQTEYDILMEEQVSFVDLPETVGGYGTEEVAGPSEAERRKMTLDEVGLLKFSDFVPFPFLRGVLFKGPNFHPSIFRHGRVSQYLHTERLCWRP